MTKTFRTYQIINDCVKYTEDYTIGVDFATYDDLIAALDELVGLAFDRYEIEEI